MQVGPSITVNPTGALNIQGYFKFAPSFSGIYDNDKFNGNYASFFVGGGVISYGMIGIGIESRLATANTKPCIQKKKTMIMIIRLLVRLKPRSAASELPVDKILKKNLKLTLTLSQGGRPN